MAFQRHICSDFDLGQAEVDRRRTQRLVNAKVANVRWAVRQYVKHLKVQGLDRAPIEPMIAKAMFRKYGVNPVLFDFAVRQLEVALNQ